MKQGVSAIDSMSKALTYYSRILNRISFDDRGSDLVIFTNVRRMSKSDATDPNQPEEGEKFSQKTAFYQHKKPGGITYDFWCLPAVGMGADGGNEYVCDVGVLAHELTHGVVAHTCSLSTGGDQSGALNEAYADIIGVAARAYYANDDHVDWKMASRDIADPSGSALRTWQDYQREARKATDRKVEEHQGSTVFSHAGYLIWKEWVDAGLGEKEAAKLLAKLFYQSLLLCTPYTSFAQARESVISAGGIMRSTGLLTQRQFDAIKRAFDKQGFEKGNPTKVVGKRDIAVTVLDVNGRAYGNYRIAFSSRTEDAKLPPAQDVVVDKGGAEGKIPLLLKASDFDIGPHPHGGPRYEFTFSDLGTSGAPDVQVSLVFMDGHTEREGPLELKVPTQFGSPESWEDDALHTNVAQDVVVVLDVSGSMGGEPLDRLRSAMGKFLDVAEKAGLRVGIVSFSNNADPLCELSSTDYAGMRAAIASKSFSAGGSTNVEAGLSEAHRMLGSSSSSARTIVLMTDGVANQGKVGDELVAMADGLKASGTSLYTLGFFSDLLGSVLKDAQDLLERMATQGEHFEATEANLSDFFTDMARQLGGVRYTYIRVACPVDVTVVSEGQVLASCAPGVASNTDFGSITYLSTAGAGDGADRVKVVRLLQGRDYQLWLNGTGSGTMDYSVSYMDEDGNYVDERSLGGVPITTSTLIQTGSAQEAETTLDIDTDGDGTTDERWRASPGSAVTVSTRAQARRLRGSVGLGCLAALMIVVAVLEHRVRTRRRGS